MCVVARCARCSALDTCAPSTLVPPHRGLVPLACPCSQEAPPGAPSAGGAAPAPHSSTVAWDWDVGTTVRPIGPIAASASATTLTNHRGGCHCGAIRFEVRIGIWMRAQEYG